VRPSSPSIDARGALAHDRRGPLVTGHVDPAVWDAFRDDPAQAGIFSDFDGTLSPLVDDPASARPIDGLVPVLTDLAGAYGCVGVLTGRPVEFLREVLPPEILLVGLYGLEVVQRGVRRDHPSGGVWREVVHDVAAFAADRAPAGTRVEEKGLSLTLHYREAPGIADAVQRFADLQAARSGLLCRPAKMSVELHPPIEVDKGTALLDHTGELRAVCFIGDDVGDLPAFDALDALAPRGVHTVRVAVAGAETDAELLGRADVVVPGPDAVVTLLRSLRP
jgi:trehalose 6-phosphate phosphatase